MERFDWLKRVMNVGLTKVEKSGGDLRGDVAVSVRWRGGDMGNWDHHDNAPHLGLSRL